MSIAITTHPTVIQSQTSEIALSPPPSNISSYSQIARNYFHRMTHDYTIGHAIDSSRLDSEREECKNFTFQEKMYTGAKAGVFGLTQGVAYSVGFQFLCKAARIPVGRKATTTLPPFIHTVLLGPIIEELIFRGGIQRGTYFTHRMIMQQRGHFTDAVMRANRNAINDDEVRVASYSRPVSPTAAIMMSNSAFAAVHIVNAGKYLSTIGAIGQVSKIFAFPIFGILYYTTGDMVAPITAHMTNNGIAWSLSRMSRVRR